ncbi:HEPN domain-containing protein [Marinomonas transparens]|uniref:HEPN domain-containing protein n=1 Tax=Marinomonas transparens TaxID=2795388 RepID=A0A934JPN2_9GAMM|nr:HEPN domain-containing protein [Marinomonas transparens]MBJ7537468.1 HEPN domain-containing protein [Marinomonas transparens]
MRTNFDHLTLRQQLSVPIISKVLLDEMDTYLLGKTSKKKHFRILKIVLFGSQAKGTQVYDPANGYVSDYDVLVIVNQEELVEEFDIWNKAEEKIERRIGRPLGLIVHSIHDINQRLHEGQYFFKDIREEGIEIYACDTRELPRPGNLTLDEQKTIAQKHYNQWFESADGFLEIFWMMIEKDLSKKKYINLAAFNLHQAAERFYSCTLLVTTNYLPKTHNIELLRSYCIRQDPRFIEQFSLDGVAQTQRFQKRSFQRLKRAYVDSRYSEHYEITEEELNWLAGEVEKLKDFTDTLCQSRINHLVNDDA